MSLKEFDLNRFVVFQNSAENVGGKNEDEKDSEIVVDEIVEWVRSSPDSNGWGPVDTTKDSFDPDRFRVKKEEE